MTGAAQAAAGPAGGRAGFPRRWVVPLLLVLAAGFLLGLRPLADNNIEFHLHGGKWILEHHAFPAGDTFTYAARGREYVDVHWLFQVAVYGLYRLAGFEGLSVLNALLGLALLALLAARMRRLGAGPASCCWVLLASAVIMHQRFLMRPENVSYLYLVLLGLLLDRHLAARAAQPPGLRSGSEVAAAAVRQLWPVPLIHLLWANTQGLFVLGWVVTGAYWVSASLRSRRPDRPLAVTLAASVLVCLANPYTVTGLLFPFRLLSRFDRANVFAQHVGEFQPLWKVGGLFEDYLLYGFALALAASCAATFRRREPHEILLPGLFGWLAVGGVRNVPLFVIVAAPVLARALTEVAATAKWRSREGRQGAGRHAARVSLALACAVPAGLLLRVLTGAFFATPGLPQSPVGLGLERSMRPVGAGEFLLANRLDGRILNSSNIGGWLGWVLPQPVFMDMRLEVMGEELFRTEVESWDEGGLDRLIGRHAPQLIVFDHNGGARAWVGQLRARDDWRLIHADPVAAVYARRGYATSLPTLDPASLPGRNGLGPLGEEAAREILGRPVSTPLRRWVAGFVQRRGEGAGALVSLGRFCDRQGASAAAERFHLEALGRDPDGSFAACGELAAIYGESGRAELALVCYDRLLRYRPRDPVAHNGRGIARVMLGDRRGAVRDFSRAVEIDSDFVFALLNRGLARAELGDTAGAGQDYGQVLRLDPGNAQAREGLAALGEVSR